MAALVIGKATRLCLNEARGTNPVPAVAAVHAVAIDQRDPRDQPTTAADHKRLVNGQLTEPADFGAFKFRQPQVLHGRCCRARSNAAAERICQRSCLGLTWLA